MLSDDSSYDDVPREDLRSSSEATGEEAKKVPKRHDLRGSFEAPNKYGGRNSKLAGKAAEKAHDYIEKKALSRFKENAKGTAIDATGSGVGALRNLKEAREKGLTSKEGRKALDKAAGKVASAVAADAIGNPELASVFQKVWDNKMRITIAIIIILFLFFFLLFDATVFDPPPQSNVPTTSDTCVPGQFTNQDAFGKTSVCTITVTYDGSAQDITIIDTILPGTDFVSAGQKGTYDKASNTVTWDAQQLGLQLDPVNITVTVTVRITTHQNNTTVWNAYSINPVGLTNSSGGGGGGVTIPGNIPPSMNDCSGIYSAYMSVTPGHQNYGDPTCTLVKKDPNGVAIINKDAILAELKTLKPSEAMAWFICVVPNESGYNANAYLGASTSGNGAYGLVQMNPTGKGNGKFDDGEVVWPLALSNGINYNDKVIGHTFSYWPTSYDSCIRSYGVTVN